MTGKEWEHIVAGWLRLSGGWDCRFEPKMQNGFRMDGGNPDFGVYFTGQLHLIECKEESESSMRLAKSTNSKGKLSGSGISPAQAAEMDRATSRGVRCWVAARLELPAATIRRLAQQHIEGKGGDVPDVVQRLVPWEEWRRRMTIAAGQRLRGVEADASIPAVELAGLGHPLRSAAELLRALDWSPPF